MVASYVQLLARRYKNRLDADADEYIDFAVDGAIRMQRLINDLLSYSRVGTRQRPRTDVVCGEIVQQALENLKQAVAESHAEIVYEALPTVRADRSQYGQLFQNIIGNAVKFRSARPLKIEINAARENEHWLFSIRDNGVGIPADELDQIFVIFHRLHSPRAYPGTGIGLAICKKNR
ncbi:MAG: ATP-binding protein [Deltaproteobacteria bacterium]|nr:ATP-binding protein [Deltaproteobacteria bacterium]